ncbi:hypothetical protein Caci_8331 [Catenulispora acidiphila DSM 44928]|uniref:DUF5667 domain-containing protein n=1 Tax=Catenulispora acidiphila (strain DSM 44928 / JCM 14897 / NBRC 102108 / NRRL B-24433 / ID139908) TaxID=479433 RepID=C7QKQ5_CATAD|nr:DUF5667 domain-containing protein [Catenulispora acidiphila]ACU77154.1 hypothetical protein Caci_8331 [Catenulispora acidiphila DSM 44928]
MAAAFGERQRAEQFARLLDGLDGSRDGGGVATLIPPQKTDPELTAMLRVVESVIDEGRAHAPAVRPEFREQLGARLHRDFMVLFNADIDGGGPGDGDVLARGRTAWRRRLIGGGVAVGVLSGGLGGVAWAASSALPGDPLYGVKRSLENMRVSVSGSDLERGDQYLGQAKTRLEEIHKLLGRHDSNVDGSDTSKLIGETTDNMYKDVDSAGQLLVPLAESGNTQALADLRGFLTTTEPQIQDLETLLSPDTQDEARRLVALMDGLDARLTTAQANLDKQRAAQQHPTSADSTSHHSGLPSTPTPTGTPSSHPVPGQHAPSQGAPTGTPSSDPSSVHLSVPIGSSGTTLNVPTLISGLPPIGITLGNTAPATGPTTGGPPNTDPNPN